MDFYEPLPEFDADGIYLDFEDRQNGIDEWIEDLFTEWMCSRWLSVITGMEYEVVSLFFGLADDEPKSYDEIAVIMNLSRKAVSRIYHQTLRRMQHYGYHLTKKMWLFNKLIIDKLINC